MRFLLPQSMREAVLKAFHNTNLTCHIGRDKMFKLIQNRFYWPGMHEDVNSWVMACEQCRKKKPFPPRNQRKLTPIKCSYPFELIGMDIVGPFKTSKNGNRYILTLIDYFTNWVEAAPIKTQNAEDVADALCNLIITRHGCPSKILTDQGTQFTSALIARLCKKFMIQKLQTSAYHLQTNGKVERFHRFLKNALSLITKPDQTNWDEMLDCCLFAHRITVNRTINETPFFLLYGRDAILPNDLIFNLPERPKTMKDDEEDEDLIDYKFNLLKTFKNAYETISHKRDLEQNCYKL